MGNLKKFAILNGIVIVISWALMDILDYIGRYNERTYAGLPLRLGWDFVFVIIFLISVIIFVLVLSIIIIHKAIQNIRKLKKIAILDGIIMVISWVLMNIVDDVDRYNERIYAGLLLRLGWDFLFLTIFLISVIMLVLVLSIIIIHKAVQKIKELKNRA